MRRGLGHPLALIENIITIEAFFDFVKGSDNPRTGNFTPEDGRFFMQLAVYRIGIDKIVTN